MKSWQGQGGYGAVYRAVRRGWRRSEPVALKVSLLPWDARFAREAEVLSRLRHPSIPRLLDRGELRAASGADYPYIVMEWVEGTPLYAWAGQHAPSSGEVCRVLAQLARALEAVHAAGAVHRDVKGDNVLVRLLDRRAVLTDFGSCHFEGADRLTWQSLPPVTRAYLSPQAGLFYIHSHFQPDGYYPPSAADDLYALGVTAYHLVMGQYPPPLAVRQDEHGVWRVTSPDARPLLEQNPRVEPVLREVIARLLSDAPESRGTAGQVAETLEAVATGDERPEPSTPPARAEAWKPWLTLAAAGASAVLLWNAQPELDSPGHEPASAQQASDAPDAGTSAVGDTAPTESQASAEPPTEKKPLAREPLPEPRPGQIQPDKKGQCPGRRQVPINGGCWVEQLPMTAEECAENSYVPFKGKCYAPALAPPKKPQPTSDPPEGR